MAGQAGERLASLQGLSHQEERIIHTVLQAIRQVRYGYIQLVLHDGKVVQIDRLEKERI